MQLGKIDVFGASAATATIASAATIAFGPTITVALILGTLAVALRRAV